MTPSPQKSVAGRRRYPQTLAQTKTQGGLCFTLITLFLLSGWVALPVMAAESSENDSTGANIILLMDSSGSMKTTDPDNLRKPAAKLLISLLGKNDHASIISFSDQGYPVTHLLNANDTNSQAQLFAAIEKISSRGAHTNLYSALVAAQTILAEDKDPRRRKIIALMSDGKMDVGNDAKSREYTEKLFSELLPQIKASNTELQIIAFTDQSDKVLLAKIAQQTNGHFYVADNDTELHNTFSKIFEDATKPSMLPVDGGHFQIDKAISEITIVGSKNNTEVKLSLTAPDGNAYFAHNKPDNYRWLVTPMFDMITINNPQSGAWDLMASSNKNKAYIITDLELELAILPTEPAVNERMQIQAWLKKSNEILASDAILSNLQLTARLTLPDGHLTELPFKAQQTNLDSGDSSGIFIARLIPPENGKYEISLTADSGTFQRTRSISFNASLAPLEVVTTALPPEIEKETIVEAMAEPLMEKTPADAEAGEIDPALLLGIYVFIGINIVLLLIVAGILLWRKRKNADND